MDYSTRHEDVLAALAIVGGSGPVSTVDEETERAHALRTLSILQIYRIKHCCGQGQNVQVI